MRDPVLSPDLPNVARAEGGGRAAGLDWPLHIAFMAAFTAFVVLYAQTLASLVHTWARSGTFEYAFLIFPVCAALVWLRRDQLRQVTAEPRRLGLAAALLLCLLWLAGAVAEINVVRHFCVVAMIPVLVYAFYGPAVVSALAFPLAYMFFAVPFGDFMVGPLQDVTAHLSVFALEWTDVPVFMSGRTIETPASSWHVAEACSGVKFFIATVAFGVLYANLFYRRLSRRLLFVLFAMVAPIVANGLRVFFTILIGEHYGLEYATGTDHLIFGWQFFGTVLLLIFLAGWPWHEFDPVAGTSTVPVAERFPNISVSRALALTVVSIAVLASAPGWYFYTQSVETRSVPVRQDALPSALDGLARTQVPQRGLDTGIQFARADARISAYYGGRVGIGLDYARYDGIAQAGQELITMRNRLFDPELWDVALRRATGVAAFDELMLQPRRNQGEPVLSWHVYRVNGHLTTSALEVKLWQAWYSLRAQPLHSSVLVLSTGADDVDDARRTLKTAAPAAIDFMARATGSTP